MLYGFRVKYKYISSTGFCNHTIIVEANSRYEAMKKALEVAYKKEWMGVYVHTIKTIKGDFSAQEIEHQAY